MDTDAIKIDCDHCDDADLIVAAINALPHRLAIAEAAKSALIDYDVHFEPPDVPALDKDLRNAVAALEQLK